MHNSDPAHTDLWRRRLSIPSSSSYRFNNSTIKRNGPYDVSDRLLHNQSGFAWPSMSLGNNAERQRSLRPMAD